MNTKTQSTIALVVAIAALGLSLFNFFQKPKIALPYTVDTFYKETAATLGMKEKKYEQCIVNENIVQNVIDDITETEAIVEFNKLTGMGTPFNLVITDSQVIPVNGAYPYEVFEFLVKEINTNGKVSAETLANLELQEMDYEIMDLIRPFNASEDHYRGSTNPSISIIEYSDFECPFCSRVHDSLDRVIENFDNVAWAYRHLPLSFHEQAMPSAIVSECIAAEAGNDAFWEFADIIFKDQKVLQK